MHLIIVRRLLEQNRSHFHVGGIHLYDKLFHRIREDQDRGGGEPVLDRWEDHSNLFLTEVGWWSGAVMEL